MTHSLKNRVAFLSICATVLFGSVATAFAAGDDDPTPEEQVRLHQPVAQTPDEAVDALKRGNIRFYGGKSAHVELSGVERQAQALSQTPFAVVLGCADSRVPTEIVFDQGPGTIFTVRVAGNVVEPSSAGSIEYAVRHLKPKVLIVLGHEGCGAVAASMGSPADQAREPENIRYLLRLIQPAVAEIGPIRDPKARMREAVIANIRLQVWRVKQDPSVAAALKTGQIAVIGAFYEIGSGAVEFLESDNDLRLTSAPNSKPPRPARIVVPVIHAAAPHGDGHAHH